MTWIYDFLEVASMVVTWGIVAFLHSDCSPDMQCPYPGGTPTSLYPEDHRSALF